MAASLAGFPALADQRQAGSASEKLPGVEGAYSIVAPAPEPLEAPSEGGGYTFKAGNTDIRISGSVSVEIGFGPEIAGEDRR
ncbi:hypothetical protein MesoLjLc_48260 [Mesorhizobium sp. L-8-10]|nr:hypothetical protein MesoLjLc_48260 [Mesorhizobium sp. L-8-10]